MRTKDLAFKLEGSDNVIFGTYVFLSDKIYYKKLSNGSNVEDIESVFDNYIELDKDNANQYNELVKCIKADYTKLDKIRSNSSKKLLFQYTMSEKLKQKLEAL